MGIAGIAEWILEPATVSTTEQSANPSQQEQEPGNVGEQEEEGSKKKVTNGDATKSHIKEDLTRHKGTRASSHPRGLM